MIIDFPVLREFAPFYILQTANLYVNGIYLI
jgi:hypothetical protein